MTQQKAKDKETKGNIVFLRKKNTPQKGKWIHYEHTETSYHLMDGAMKQSHISQNIFSYLKMFSMQCRKNIKVEDNKKKKE